MIKKILNFCFFFIPIFLYSQDLIVVKNILGKYGFADKYGDTLIECKYDYAENFAGGLALVKNNLEYKIIDTSGRIFDLIDYNGSFRFRHDFGEYHTGLPVIAKEWDCYFISSSGEVYLEIPYRDASSFEGGKAKVFDGDKYNYISKNGLLLDKWQKLEDDYHAIKNNDKFGYIDRNGKLVIDYQFINAKDFENGLAQISNGTQWAVINKNGEKISDWYEKIYPFNGNLAIVEKLGSIGFIDRKGKFLEQWYTTILPLDFGLYQVSKYEQYAVVSSEGYLVTQWFDEVYRFENGYLKVKKEGKYAFINKIGALVIGWYDNISDVKDGIILVKNNEKYSFFNIETFTLSDFFDYLGDFNDGLALIKQKEKYGFINKYSQIVIPLDYDYAQSFQGGVAQIKKGDKTAYINTKGEIVLGWLDAKKFMFNEAPQGLIAVKYGRKYGFESLNGKRAIAAQFDYAENFQEGLALVKNNPQEMYIGKNGEPKPLTTPKNDPDLRLDFGYGHLNEPIIITIWECSFIDYSGKVVLKLDYQDASSFSNGQAKVVDGDKYNFIDTKGKLIDKWKDFEDDFHADFKNGKFGFVDKNGANVIDYKYNSAQDFHNSRAKVRIGDKTTGKFAFINKKGDFITKMYDELTDYTDNYAIAKLNNKFVLIDTAGVELSIWYDAIESFSEKMAKVKKENKYSFINTFGKQIPLWFDDAGTFQNGRAKVKIGVLWGFVSKEGKLAVKPEYNNVFNFQNNIAKVEKDGKNAFIDLNGKLITEWYDQVFLFSEERAVICKDGKWGYIDASGKLVVKPMYDKAFAFYNGVAIVIDKGVMIKIDKFGKTISDEKNN